MTGEEVLPETGLLEKAATIRRFEYSPLGIELKKQTDIAKKQYEGLDKVYKFNKNNYCKNLTFPKRWWNSCMSGKKK